MTYVSFPLSSETRRRLQVMAELTGRSETALVIEAVTEHLDDLDHDARQRPAVGAGGNLDPSLRWDETGEI